MRQCTRGRVGAIRRYKRAYGFRESAARNAACRHTIRSALGICVRKNKNPESPPPTTVPPDTQDAFGGGVPLTLYRHYLGTFLTATRIVGAFFDLRRFKYERVTGPVRRASSVWIGKRAYAKRRRVAAKGGGAHRIEYLQSETQ